MFDFLMISATNVKKGEVEIFPKFLIYKGNKQCSDLMIRGGDFYAVWLEDKGLWSTNEQDAFYEIDKEVDRYVAENQEKYGLETKVKVKHMWDSDSGLVDKWHKFCQKQMRDNFHALDETLIFSNTEVKKENYASKRLPYALEKGTYDSYDTLLSVLYSDEERHKLEWAIGAIVAGDSKTIQKFCVLYGAPGTGKSTVLNIIEKLFVGYCASFDSKALGSSNSSFALEPFKKNPLVGIQHDGDLSRIEDNTRLNSLVAHEALTVNAKFEKLYEARFKTFLFMGTNKPVKITDAKSGIIRRLIDISPTGNKVPPQEYKQLYSHIDYELGAIAAHCLEVYNSAPDIYDNYIPTTMLGATNDFYDFVLDSYYIFKEEDGTTLKAAWEMYKAYCEEAKVPYPMSQRPFKEELKNYFENYEERARVDDMRVRSYYSGFIFDKFTHDNKVSFDTMDDTSLKFNCTRSLLDKELADCPAQYANEDEKPSSAWANVETKLSDIDTSKTHYVRVPLNHIVIDFDISDPETNEKSFELNLAEANKWPPTYAELSKSGKGIHLHYIYTGDPLQLQKLYGPNIEIKVFNGKSSLRRRLTKCNNLPIATISSGLPMKGDKMVNFEAVKSEQGLRKLIQRNLNKEIHPGTKPSVDFIYKILEDAYNSGLKYDVSDMHGAILAFASNSTHQAETCVKLVSKMRFMSDEASLNVKPTDDRIVFFDVEVFPNLFLVNWKFVGKDKTVVRMINPTPTEIEELLQFKLVGFNNRRYDNHILYARLLGYSNLQLFNLSQRIINSKKGDPNNGTFGEAYNVSYTDIYDYAAKKQSLKKWEIELGIHHQELGFRWDEPVPEDQWVKVAEYCDNDVYATEAVWEATQADFTARKILAALAGGTVNDTTNSLTTRIIFGTERHPQDSFNYRNMSDESDAVPFLESKIPDLDKYTMFNSEGKPIFPGYLYDSGKSTYRGEEVGEGGYVYAEPGMYTNVALLDIASMHPSSIVAECLFGDTYTKRFNDILQARIYIKHGEFDKVRSMLGGKLAPFLDDESKAKQLAQALKIAINSVYGLTAATFPNPFRHPDNRDNIVAKRGALFMVNLKHEVQKRGYKVAHIKTDSIKIPNATPEIIKFVTDYGKLYGYNFEHEATYERMCLVNDAVYIARYSDTLEWTATGTQFQVPYVFKKCFSKEDICFEDLCETKSVKDSMYLDMNENLPDVSAEEKELDGYSSKYKHGEISDMEYESVKKRLQPIIDKGHDYVFIGKVGSFCPMTPGSAGGLLMRLQNGKYYAVTGTKGYRWLEAEQVKTLGKENDIDISYYDHLVDEAVETISKYGDFNKFANGEDVLVWDFMNIPEGYGPDGMPFEDVPPFK